MNYETVIGLEVHAQLLTETKIFCGCPASFGAEPNTHTCPVCLGMPGVLPVLNRKVVDYAVRLALATGCRIRTNAVFARKNYFYPDLPKGYQISMFEQPLAEDGFVTIDTPAGEKRIGLTRIHLEEDAGKSIHDETRPVSYVDLNRAGVPLVEIVSQPDLSDPDEAVRYLKTLRDILLYLGISDGNMEEGSFRCDANISLRPVGSPVLGTRTELKNMNSFRHVARALEYEIRRQTAVLSDGEAVLQETRLWNETKGVTEPMRGKEESHDYRYFPEPDLIPLKLDPNWLNAIRHELPELPRPRRQRLMAQYGLSEYDAEVLTGDRALADYFEAAVGELDQPKALCNWILSELLRELGESGKTPADCPLSPTLLAGLVAMIHDGRISGKIAKTVFQEMYRSGRPAPEIVAEKGLVVVNDEAALLPLIEEILAKNPSQAAQYRAGKEKVIGFFVGQLMKATKGQADPQALNALLKEKLKG